MLKLTNRWLPGTAAALSLATLWLMTGLLATNLLAAPINPDLRFNTNAQEQQYQKLVKELRCTVCQSESIYESNSSLAADVRRKVYEMTLEGQTEQEIIDYMVERYGDYVRFRPAMQSNTFALWLSPFALLLVGGLIWWQVVARRKSTSQAAPAALSEQDKRQLAKIRQQK